MATSIVILSGMILGAILLGLLSMVGYGLANTYSLPLAKKHGPARLLMLRGITTCLILFLTAIPSLNRARDWRAMLATFLIGILGYLPVLAFTHGIKVSRVSIVAPISGTSPFITVLLSVLIIGAHLHSLQWLGIALIVAANIAVSLNFKSFKESNVLKLSSGVPFALIAALLWGLVFFLLIYPTRSLGPWLSALMIEIGVMIAAGSHVWLRHEPFMFKESVKGPMIANACLIVLGTLSYTIGVHSFNIGLVAALSNSTAIISITAATIVHHERLTRSEKILAVLMGIGVVLISIA